MNELSRRSFIRHCASGVAGVALAGAGCQAPAPQRKHPGLLVGTARVDVTPPVWIPYLTSAGNGSNAPFRGVHDRLFARALVAESGGEAIAVLSVDSIGYDNALLAPKREFTAEVRRRIADKTRLPAANIQLACTHSHATPETIGLTRFREEPLLAEWLQGHVDKLAEAVVQAWKSRAPATVCGGKTVVTGIARNRRILLRDGSLNRHGAVPDPVRWAAPAPLDEELSWMAFKHLDGRPTAVILNYTAHPVATMLLPEVSADYCGAACRDVENAFPGCTCLFTNGAAGNVNSIHVSTAHSDAEQIGRQLSRAFLQDFRDASSPDEPAPVIRSVSRQLTLESRTCPSVEQALLTLHSAPTDENRRMLRLAQKLAEGPIQAELQAIRLGDWRWISIPGEAFVETGLALKQAGASFVVGYANGWVGYLPIQSAYAQGGYEVLAGAWSRVAPGSAEAVETQARALLRQLDEPAAGSPS